MGMYDDNYLIEDEQFEAFLDGALSGSVRETVRSRVSADHELQAQIALQERINHTLHKLFRAVDPPARILDQPVLVDLRNLAGKSRYPSRRLLAIGTAAALVAVVVTWFLQQDDRSTPFFKPIPLAGIYVDTIRNGFQPYYECHDDQRFAAIFARRQDRPLRLLPLPDGVEMLGLSYPGGLSRDTTAMLCRVNGEPVLVFVDREIADRAQNRSPDDNGTNIFRAQRNGLVFYEVSRLKEPRVMQFLAPLKPPASSP